MLESNNNGDEDGVVAERRSFLNGERIVNADSSRKAEHMTHSEEEDEQPYTLHVRGNKSCHSFIPEKIGLDFFLFGAFAF